MDVVTNIDEFVVFIFVNVGQKLFIREPGALGCVRGHALPVEVELRRHVDPTGADF